MSGHSKWNNIKNRKGAMDAKKSKQFSLISRLIKAAVREGSSDDPSFNPNLRTLLDKARAANMPKDKVQRAIDRGMGRSVGAGAIKEIQYEGFAPNGIGLIIVALTDNTQRTSSSLREVLSKAGGSMGGPNSVMYAFSRNHQGEFEPTIPMPVTDEATIEKLETLLDTIRENEDVEEVYIQAVWNGKDVAELE